ncbi:MAG: lysylphosphatidylglycerol synthase transmembrane domain-containing protein [Chitinophagaceae bacterium]
MKKKVFSLLQYILFLGLAIFLVWWSLGKIEHKDWLDIKGAWLRADFWLLIPVVLILLLSHFSRAVRWKILMQPLDYYPSILNVFCAVLVSYIANLAIPRLGEVLKCTILSRYEKVPADKLVGTVVAERAFDLLCLAIVFAITFFTQVDVIGDYASGVLDKIFNTGASVSSRIIKWTLIILVLIGLFTTVRWAFKKFAHISLVQKIKEILGNIWHGLTSIRYLRNKGWFIFHTVLIWVCYLGAIRVGMEAMKETTVYGVKESLSVLCMGSIGMIATQGGVGAYPLLVQETMMLYGLTENMGKAFGWLLWLVQFFMVIVFGALSLFLLPIINRKKETDEKPGNNTTENIHA